jgi:hypothetical protein
VTPDAAGFAQFSDQAQPGELQSQECGSPQGITAGSHRYRKISFFDLAPGSLVSSGSIETLKKWDVLHMEIEHQSSMQL